MNHLLAILAAARAPFSFRFIVQPVLAIVLGFRDGRQDAIAGRPPWFLSLLSGRRSFKAFLKEGARTVGMPFCVAVLLDGVVQVMVDNQIRIWRMVVVGILLIGLPYIISRGLSNRIWVHVESRRRTA